MFIEVNGEEFEVEGTRNDLEAWCRMVGLVGDGDDQWSSMSEFLARSEISVYHSRTGPLKTTIEALVKSWV